MYTIWGNTDRITTLADGIIDVGTPSHGGIMVKESVAHSLLTPEAIKVGAYSGGYLCYEEDCDWAIVAWELPQIRTALAEKVFCSPSSVDESELFDTVCAWNCNYARARGYYPQTMTDDEIRQVIRNK